MSIRYRFRDNTRGERLYKTAHKLYYTCVKLSSIVQCTAAIAQPPPCILHASSSPRGLAVSWVLFCGNKELRHRALGGGRKLESCKGHPSCSVLIFWKHFPLSHVAEEWKDKRRYRIILSADYSNTYTDTKPNPSYCLSFMLFVVWCP